MKKGVDPKIEDRRNDMNAKCFNPKSLQEDKLFSRMYLSNFCMLFKMVSHQAKFDADELQRSF